MAQYLSIAVRAFGVGAIIVIIAVVTRQVYLQVAAERPHTSGGYVVAISAR